MPKPKKSARGQRGDVGPKTVEAVEKLIANGLKRTKAFAEVAKATGRKPGTVAVTYYKLRGRAPGAAGSGRGRATSSEAVISRVLGAVKDLAKMLRQQDREIARLRSEAAWAKQLRGILRGR